jgi:hypothetical protein
MTFILLHDVDVDDAPEYIQRLLMPSRLSMPSSDLQYVIGIRVDRDAVRQPAKIVSCYPAIVRGGEVTSNVSVTEAAIRYAIHHNMSYVMTECNRELWLDIF